MPKIDRSLDKTVEDEIREENKKRKGKKRITHDDVFEQQFNALVSKQENMEVKSDHRSKFSNLSNWKEEA